MTIREACQLLGVESGAGEAELKASYHRLMMLYHPDAHSSKMTANPEAEEMAKRINEAYHLLKRENAAAGGGKARRGAGNGSSPGGARQRGSGYGGESFSNGSGRCESRSGGESSSARPGASGFGTEKLPRNDAAFCSRVLWSRHEIFGEAHVIRLGEGKYYWDPDTEDFDLLLRSVHQCVAAQLESVERRCGIMQSWQRPSEEMYLQAQMKLLHLLIQEFVDPYRIFEYQSERQRPRPSGPRQMTLSFRVSAVGGRGRSAAQQNLSEEEVRKDSAETFRITEKSSRLYLYQGDVLLGRVTFEEDYLYYVVTPLIMNGSVQYEVEAPEADRGCRGRDIPSRQKYRLTMRLKEGAKRHPGGAINLEIADTLQGYQHFLQNQQ